MSASQHGCIHLTSLRHLIPQFLNISRLRTAHGTRNGLEKKFTKHSYQVAGNPLYILRTNFFFSPNRCCPPLLPEFLTQSFFPLFLSSKCFVSAATTEGRGDVTSALKHPILKRSHNVDSCNRYACRAW